MLFLRLKILRCSKGIVAVERLATSCHESPRMRTQIRCKSTDALVRAGDRLTQLVLLRSWSESSEDIAVEIPINQLRNSLMILYLEVLQV